MKPENAIKLPTDADLSEASLESALDIIAERIPKNEKTEYGCISIPSQLLGETVLLTRYSELIKLKYARIHLYIEINSQYASDEWSVTVNRWDFSDKNATNNPITIWSPGA